MNTWKLLEDADITRQSEPASVGMMSTNAVLAGLFFLVMTTAMFFDHSMDLSFLWIYIPVGLVAVFFIGAALREWKLAQDQRAFQAELRQALRDDIMKRYNVTQVGVSLGDFGLWYDAITNNAAWLEDCIVQLEDYTWHTYGIILNDNCAVQLVNLDTPSPDVQRLRAPESETLQHAPA